jgi:CheY-like chemotaxis protein
VLRELGYHVIEAADAHRALALLDDPALHVDLLFTDVVLPGGLTGADLAEAALKRRPTLRVLFTTGYARNAIVHHGRLDPGVHLLPKPFTYTDLAHKLRELLDG